MSDWLQVTGLAALFALGAYHTHRRLARRGAQVPSPILPASELQKRHGLYAENRPEIRLEPGKVPPHLHDLIPLAETWGIGDDIIRFDFQEKASDAAKRELVAALSDRIDAVQEWVNAQPADVPLSEEAAAFLHLLSAWDEVRPVDPA